MCSSLPRELLSRFAIAVVRAVTERHDCQTVQRDIGLVASTDANFTPQVPASSTSDVLTFCPSSRTLVLRNKNCLE